MIDQLVLFVMAIFDKFWFEMKVLIISGCENPKSYLTDTTLPTPTLSPHFIGLDITPVRPAYQTPSPRSSEKRQRSVSPDTRKKLAEDDVMDLHFSDAQTIFNEAHNNMKIIRGKYVSNTPEPAPTNTPAPVTVQTNPDAIVVKNIEKLATKFDLLEKRIQSSLSNLFM